MLNISSLPGFSSGNRAGDPGGQQSPFRTAPAPAPPRNRAIPPAPRPRQDPPAEEVEATPTKIGGLALCSRRPLPTASPRLPRLASPRLASPRLASPRLASPRRPRPRLASPRALALASPRRPRLAALASPPSPRLASPGLASPPSPSPGLASPPSPRLASPRPASLRLAPPRGARPYRERQLASPATATSADGGAERAHALTNPTASGCHLVAATHLHASAASPSRRTLRVDPGGAFELARPGAGAGRGGETGNEVMNRGLRLVDRLEPCATTESFRPLRSPISATPLSELHQLTRAESYDRT